MLTRVEQWEEWMARCAIGRCSAATAAALTRFGARRFRHYLEVCLGATFCEGVVPDDRACFHLFETYSLVGTPRSGKRYKQWIGDRGDAAPDAALFESGASLLLRDTVRTYLRHEGPALRQVSADAVVAGTDGLTLADLLPDTREPESASPELAEAVARACLAGLTEKHRVVVFARRAGIPLNHPAILRLTGVGKSWTAQLWAEVYKRLAAETRRRVPEGDREIWVGIALEASKWLGDHLFFQERVEMRWRQYFKGVEDLYG